MAAILVLLLQERLVVLLADAPRPDPSPRLDAMAADGVRFAQFYAGGPTPSATRRALLGGRHARRAAPPSPLPVLLRDAGYATCDAGPEEAVDFLRAKRESPLFALVSLGADYDAEAGKILDVLQELGGRERTLVFFTFARGVAAGKLRGSPGELYEGVLRVPAIAWGRAKPGVVNDEHAYVGDLFATLLELAGLPAPKDVDSDSLLPALRGEARAERWRRKHELYWESDAAQACRFGKWKAIRSNGALELYDMSNDAGEKRDYSVRRPDLARHAAAVLDKFSARE